MRQYIQVQVAQLIHYKVKTNRVYINYYGYTIISQKANKRNRIFAQYQYYIFVQPNDTASTGTHEISAYCSEIYKFKLCAGNIRRYSTAARPIMCYFCANRRGGTSGNI